MSSGNESLTSKKYMCLFLLQYYFEEKLFFISVSNNIPFPFKGLRTPEERVQFLRNIPTAFNFRLEAPLRNLKTQADAEEEYPEEFRAFLDNYKPLRRHKVS